MQMRIDDAEEDFGTLVVIIGKDDQVSLGGFGEKMVLRLPLYSHEAEEIIQLLAPIADAGTKGEQQ